MRKNCYNWPIAVLFLCCVFMIDTPSYAHHGGASAAFGPGAPIETTSPLTLPKGKFLFLERGEYVPFEQRENAEPNNIKTFTFLNTLLGYGITDALSLFAIQPYAIKDTESSGTSSGIGDLGFLVQYGFKLGTRDGIRGVYSCGPEDSKGEHYTLSDLKMSLLAGFTVPSGTIDNKTSAGNTFGVGLQHGFGSPSFTFGFAASKMIFPHFTLTVDSSLLAFTQHDQGKPGNEIRFNVAEGYEIFERTKWLLRRIDIIEENNLLHLRKDQNQDRSNVDNSGGTILYLSPGVRTTWAIFGKTVSVGALIKFPAWKDLNNEPLQQGSEGLEHYRAIITCSIPF